jgi:hypothetical protein
MCQQMKSDGLHSRVSWPVRTAQGRKNQPKRDVQRLIELSIISNSCTHLPCSNFTPTFRCSLTWDYDWYTCCWCTMRCQAKMPESPRTIPNRSPHRLNDKPVRASGYPEVNITDACIPLNHCNAAVRREMFSFNFSLVERLCHSCKVTWLDLLRSTASTLRRSATTLGA